MIKKNNRFGFNSRTRIIPCREVIRVLKSTNNIKTVCTVIVMSIATHLSLRQQIVCSFDIASLFLVSNDPRINLNYRMKFRMFGMLVPITCIMMIPYERVKGGKNVIVEYKCRIKSKIKVVGTSMSVQKVIME